MFNPNKNNIAPILWVDSTSRDDSSKRMLNFMKKTFEVFPVISIEEAENILTKEKR